MGASSATPLPRYIVQRFAPVDVLLGLRKMFEAFATYLPHISLQILHVQRAELSHPSRILRKRTSELDHASVMTFGSSSTVAHKTPNLPLLVHGQIHEMDGCQASAIFSTEQDKYCFWKLLP
jgi:hypothetical protein